MTDSVEHELYKPLYKTLWGYSLASTVHGFAYIMEEKEQGARPWTRIMWIVVVLTGATLATLLSAQGQ